MDPVESARPLQILLVEDNPADVRMTREARAFLLRDGAFAGAPIPDLVLLDLSLPGLSGHGVLQVLRDRRTKRTFPGASRLRLGPGAADLSTGNAGNCPLKICARRLRTTPHVQRAFPCLPLGKGFAVQVAP